MFAATAPVDKSVERLRETPGSLCTTTVEKWAKQVNIPEVCAFDQGLLESGVVHRDVLEVALEGCV